MYKVIVAHPGQQHSYRTAIALKEKGMLYAYITTVYDKKNSSLMSLIKRTLKKDNAKRANGRKSDKLEDNEVVQFNEIGGLIVLAILRIDKTKGRILYNTVNRWVSNSFGRKVARYAVKHNVDAVICYDANSMSCFRYLKKNAPHIIRIMDNAAPNRYGLYQEYQLLNEKFHVIDNQPDAFKKFLVDKKEAEYYRNEAFFANKHLVASSFAKRMLTSIGVRDEDCLIVPYGFNRVNNEQKSEKTGVLKFLFVGEISAQKGIFNYIEVAKTFKGQAEFHAVGGGIENLKQIYQKGIHENVIFHGYMLQNELFELYKQMDIFVFPSLGDGFGFVVLEALSFGLPVICSKNSVGEDIIQDGYNGFLFDAGSTATLQKIIQWFIDNTMLIGKMKNHAIESVAAFTWTRYSDKMSEVMDDIMRKTNGE